MEYKIIVDSSCDLPLEILEKYDIDMLPLTISFGEDQYRDKVDITPKEFYEKLVNSNEMPKTSQVTPEAFIQAFKKHLDNHKKIICITLSSKASGTYQSANLAKQELESEDIYLIDSKMLCLGTGLLVVKLAKMLSEGKEISYVLEQAEELKYKIEHLFCVDTLKYLKKGGRIKATSAVIGEILNIKPILNVDEGITQTIGKVRGRKRVFTYYMDHIEKTIDLDKTDIMAVAHSNDEEGANKMVDMIRERFNFDKEIIISEVGATIGTHSGPGVLAVFYIKK